MQHVKK
jgi:hypothetical protein